MLRQKNPLMLISSQSVNTIKTMISLRIMIAIKPNQWHKLKEGADQVFRKTCKICKTKTVNSHSFLIQFGNANGA